MSIKIREDEEGLYEELNRTGIRIGVIVTAPHAYPCFFDSPGGPNCTAPGLGIELTLALCQVMRLPCHLIPVNHSSYGAEEEGEWVGMVREVMDGLYDTSLPVFNPTPARAKVVGFSYPVYSETNLVATKFPTIETFKSGAILFAISPPVWCLIFGTVLVMGLLFALFQISSKPPSLRRFGASCFRNTFDAVAVLASQDVQSSSKGEGMRVGKYILLGLWGLACVVLAGMYSSQIVATALDFTLALPFSSLSSAADCVRNKKCRMSTTSVHNSYYDRIYNAKEGPLFQLQQAFRANPPHIVVNSSSQGILENYSDGMLSLVYLSSSSYASLIRTFPPCSFDGVQVQSFDPVAFPLPFHHPLTAILNRAITLVRETGIVSRLFSKYTGKYIVGQERCKAVETFAEAMPLKAFTGAFFLLLAGVALAMSLLLGEKVVRQWRRKHA